MELLIVILEVIYYICIYFKSNLNIWNILVLIVIINFTAIIVLNIYIKNTCKKIKYKEDINLKLLIEKEFGYGDIQLNKIFIIENDSLEIFVDICNNIYICKNLLHLLDDKILKSLIIHELSHIKFKDLRIFYFIMIKNFLNFIFVIILFLIKIISKIDFIRLLFIYFLIVIIKSVISKKLYSKYENRADRFVIEKGYKEELIKGIDFYLETYRIDYSSEPSLEYMKLKKRKENLRNYKKDI